VGAASASGILNTKIELAQRSARSVSWCFWTRTDAAILLPLRQLRTYDLARASVPLMEAALARCQVLSSQDPVAAGMIPYLEHHIEEERNHDMWLLEDLEALGMPREQVIDRVPSLTAARLVGAQYYWIYHDHPIALLGYMAVLEGGLVGEEFIEDFVARTGIPHEGVRTLLLHARIDHQHTADLDRLIDSLPLTDRHATTMGLSAFHTVDLLATLTQEVMDEAPEPVTVATAVSQT
jgi:Iron-containing redox enzyme